MDRTVRVRTPESIAFSYELAGLGSRFLAVAIDTAIQVVLLIGIFWGIALIGTHAPKTPAQTPGAAAVADSFVWAFVAAILFLVFFGYFIAFEGFWNGQTPGKRLMGLRVVRDGGYAADFGSVALRNLIRVGEFVAGFYALSAIAALLSPENKRLGDIAAGTLVVRDVRSARPAHAAHDQLQPARIGLLSDDERALIDRFVARRTGMAPGNRAAFAAQLAGRVRPRVSRDLQGLADEELLEHLSVS